MSFLVEQLEYKKIQIIQVKWLNVNSSFHTKLIVRELRLVSLQLNILKYELENSRSCTVASQRIWQYKYAHEGTV